jgi:hypothetical protein
MLDLSVISLLNHMIHVSKTEIQIYDLNIYGLF